MSSSVKCDTKAKHRSSKQLDVDARMVRAETKLWWAKQAKDNKRARRYRYGLKSGEKRRDSKTESEMWFYIDLVRKHGCSNSQCANLVGINRNTFRGQLSAHLSKKSTKPSVDAIMDDIERNMRSYRELSASFKRRRSTTSARRTTRKQKAHNDHEDDEDFGKDFVDEDEDECVASPSKRRRSGMDFNFLDRDLVLAALRKNEGVEVRSEELTTLGWVLMKIGSVLASASVGSPRQSSSEGERAGSLVKTNGRRTACGPHDMS